MGWKWTSQLDKYDDGNPIDLRAQIKHQVHLDKYDDGTPIDLIIIISWHILLLLIKYSPFMSVKNN